MNSAKSFLLKFGKFIGIQTANIFEAISTGICSFSAFSLCSCLMAGYGKLLVSSGFFCLPTLLLT